MPSGLIYIDCSLNIFSRNKSFCFYLVFNALVRIPQYLKQVFKHRCVCEILRDMAFKVTVVTVDRDGVFKIFNEPRNLLQEIDSARLCSLAGRYDILNSNSVPNLHRLF
jgi:hypothetical protein